MLLTIVGACALVMLVSLLGKLATWGGVGALIERNLHFLVSFASGVMLAIAYGLASEIAERGALSSGIPWMALGAAALLALFRFMPHFHHHHEANEHAHSVIDAHRVLVSDAVHNISDGAVVALSFIASPAVGIASTLSIMVHEALQEISEFFVLREAGISATRALVLNLAASSTILLGGVGAYLLLESFASLEIPLLGVAVGSYLVVVFKDLLPHSWQSVLDSGHALRHIAFFVAGLLAMTIVVLVLPHGAH